MKTRQFIILFAFLGILALIYFPIMKGKEEKTEDVKKKKENYLPIFKVTNQPQVQQLDSYGQIIGVAQFNVTMKVQGEIDRDNRLLKPGMTFKKNEILVKVDRTEALYNLLSRRSQFINLIAGVIPDIGIDLPEETEKWKNYLRMISPTASLPNLPEINSEREKLLINGRNITAEYYGIKSAESQVENYLYLAPFNGVIVESFVEPGSMITPGTPLLMIAENDKFEVKAPINISQVDAFTRAETVHFTDAQGDTLGNGKLLRTSPQINSQTQSVDAYFSIDHAEDLVIGAFVNLTVNSVLQDSTVVLPEIAAQNGVVQLLRDSLINKQKVTVVGTKQDSVFVKGIANDEYVILQPVENVQDSIKYIGIKRN